ncbi:MAG TPA: hypothetical protein DEQ38_14740 [Elusimicrobia bacterium]|nr:MAG: hypothetical protein A2089_03665 [Elusimicrobia bacterium GWD2_63_28]HCC49350.1 hypothetical protein [Elusimicrobiota bacterium]
MPQKGYSASFIVRLILASACLFAWAAPAAARHYYSWEKKPEKTFHVKARTRLWMASTSAQVRSSMFTPSSWWTPPSDNISRGSTYDFKSMDAPLLLFSLETQPLRGFSLEFETGDNKFSKGKYYEHDWLHATNQTLFLLNGVVWDSPQHRDYAKKEMQTSGRARQYSAAAYLNVYKTGGFSQDEWYELEHSLDLFVGYSWYETKVRLFNGNKIMSTDFFLPTAPVGPMTGLDSRARMAWYGWRGGFRERAVLGKNFFAEARFGFGPTMKYRGENYWNLDTALANPGVRNAATGILTEFEISASWKFWKQFRAEAGWMVWAYRAASGRETYRYADGSTWEGTLNRVKATRKGLYLGLSWQY